MSVSHATVKAAILAICTSANSSAMSNDDYADDMATVIVNAITSAELDTITATAGGDPVNLTASSIK